ncbi:MAG: hypothetical protein JWO68_3741 [Actinomycetia bacterium]|nr:hypothetical protein [Actinomycetes bacterium]
MATSPDTVTDALRLLHDDGYTEDFNITDQLLSCSACQVPHEPVVGIIERQYRFEGASDPDDEAVVFGVRCPACGARGVVVSAFGPGADPETLEWLRKAGA